MRNKNRNASVMIAAILVAVVLLVFSQIYIMVGVSQKNAAERFNRRVKAFYLANSGLDHSLSWIRQQTLLAGNVPPSGNKTNPWNVNGTVTVIPISGINCTYNVTITDCFKGGCGALFSGLQKYKVTSVGIVQGVSRNVTDFIQQSDYAGYLWFTKQESYGGNPVWFWSQDVLNGPTQTNGNFNIYGNPKFNNVTGSTANYIDFYNNGHNVNLNFTTSNPPYDQPVFNDSMGGMQFGLQPANMTQQAIALRTNAQSGGKYFTGDTTVTLNTNSTMIVTNSNLHPSTQTMALPGNSALFVNNGDLTVSGVLNGKITMGASQDINIPNNITYAHDPRTNSTSTDTMGLISEGDVVINQNAPTNLEIDGCIMALGTSFYLNNWDTVAAKGNLTVYGGIIQDERGPVGTFNAATGTKISGYSKNYLYDSRLLANPPAFMPTTGDYVTLSWQEN